VVSLLADGAILEVAGQKRPSLLELAQHIAAERSVRRQELARPPLALGVPRPAKLAHPRPHERQILDWVDERVPLEERAVFPEQPVELGAVVAGAETAEEDEVLRLGDRRDDVDLQEAEPANRREHIGRAPVEQLSPDGDPARLLDAHRSLRGHAPIFAHGVAG